MALGYGNKYGYSYGLADPVSLLVPLGNLLPYQGLSSNADGSPPLPIGTRELIENVTLDSGPITTGLPISSPSSTTTGVALRTYFDDIYNRFYLIPSNLDLGLIVDYTTTEFVVWNAHLTLGTLEFADASTLTDSRVDVNVGVLPDSLPALSETTYSVTADLSGPTDIAGAVSLLFSPTETQILTVSGVRGKLWPFLPNWDRRVSETWTYKTEILTMRSGREQRLGLRETPRKSLEFSGWVAYEDRRTLSNLLNAYQHVDFVVADIPRHVVALEEVPTGVTSFEVSDLPDWLAPNTLVIVVSGYESELRYVENVNLLTNTINFKDTSLKSFEAGSYICAPHKGNLDSTIATNRRTDEVAEFTFRFDCTPGSESFTTPSAAPVTYLGREVFTLRPNWAEPLTRDFLREVEKVDYDRGIAARFAMVQYGSQLNKLAFTNRSYDDAKLILDAFTRCRGQRGEMFVPSWDNDIEPKLNLINAGTEIRVEGAEFSRMYAGSDVFKTIMIRLTDGTILYRSVTGMYVVDNGAGNDTIIMLSAAWPRTILLVEIDMICWMPVCRFASDSLTIEWVTDSVSQMQVTLRTLEYLAAEA